MRFSHLQTWMYFCHEIRITFHFRGKNSRTFKKKTQTAGSQFSAQMEAQAGQISRSRIWFPPIFRRFSNFKNMWKIQFELKNQHASDIFLIMQWKKRGCVSFRWLIVAFKGFACQNKHVGCVSLLLGFCWKSKRRNKWAAKNWY